MIAAIYARKSTDQNVTDEEKSVTRQVEHARAYAAAKGWTLNDEHVYADDGISGAEFAKRPGYLRLLNALKPRAPFQVLIMSEESRLGRESLEVGYALKQLSQAGVRVWLYLDDRERLLESPTDKLLMSVTTFADEMEREKACQRTADAMLRKARAGHVAGGTVFGYVNERVADHVERRVHEDQAAVVRRIFTLAAAGAGLRAIAHTLNAEGALAPRPRPAGRPTGWAPSSIREVLHRDLYRGLVVWNKRKKRDQWGVTRVRPRPTEEWVRRDAPELRIVEEALWQATHQRIAGTRQTYLRGTAGQLWGRPANGIESKYLLTGLAACGWCGGTLEVRSGGGAHRDRRRHFYGCTSYHRRGTTVCRNRFELPLVPTEQAVLEAVEHEVLDPEVVTLAVNEPWPSCDGLSNSILGMRQR